MSCNRPAGYQYGDSAQRTAGRRTGMDRHDVRGDG
nr:MAG TPA: hypothetical protein [Caudoviricetes sp.]